MKVLKHYSALLALLVLSFSSLSSLPWTDDFLPMLKARLATFNKQVPDEKVYLHIDKPFYKPGEDIWFQAYLVEGKQHKPSTISNVLYVELLDPKGNLAKKLTLAVQEGGAKGDFQLEPNAAGGLYKIRAYTKWMQNFKEASFFSKEFQVQKVVKPKLLLKLDFEKDAYGPSDEVNASLQARDLENLPVAGQEIRFTVQLAGRELISSTTTTDHSGAADIRFRLPDSLNTNDGLLNILIPHKGITESISRSVPIVLNRISLEFFPEGGDMVAGVETKIGFKALNEFGKAADIEGVIMDPEGKVVRHFASYHKGMGVFTFNPEKGKTYTAKITRPVKSAREYKLPAVMDVGYVMGIEQEAADQLSVSVYSPVDKPVYLVGQIRGEIYYSQKINPRKGINTIAVPLKDFPVGVVQFTLFDHHQIERCERLVFVNQGRRLYVDLQPNKEHYQPREKVSVSIKTYDEDGMPIPARLSLSVVDDKVLSFADDKQDNILSYLLLSSDLKGEIEEPSFYFDPEEPKAQQALDHLLMTQGWRRFIWQEVMTGSTKIAFYPEMLGSVSGKVVNRDTQKPIDATVTLVELNNRRRGIQLRTKEDGSFLFLNVDPAAPVQLFAKGSFVKQENVGIVLDRTVSPYYNFLAQTGLIAVPDDEMIFEIVEEEETILEEIIFEQAPEEEAYAAIEQEIILQEDVQQLPEVVVVTGYGYENTGQLTASVASINGADSDVLLPNQSLEQALQGKMAGLRIGQNSGSQDETARIMIRGTSSLGNNQPLFVVDGFPLDNRGGDGLSALGFLSPSDIKSVTVMKSPEATALYGSRASNGVVLVNTKTGNHYNNYNRRFQDNYASLYIAPRTFSVVREYAAPDYAEELKAEKRTDFRETIYWNPAVETDRNGEAKVSFYNSDATTAFRITAEGIGVNGYVGRQEEVFSSLLPLSLEAKIPAYLSFEDKVSIPIQLTNNTNEQLTGRLLIDYPACFLPVQAMESQLRLEPNTTQTYYFDATVQNQAGKFSLKLAFESDSFRDEIEQEIEVLPKGFPVEVSFSAQDLQKSFSFRINEPVPGSVSAAFTAYPNVVGELLAGIESVLREPHGCFEQVSSSAYPNVLALQFLRETGQSRPEIESRALALIKSGYEKLAAYETSQGGFEWYGRTPPHESLTAFGLLQFSEIQKVYGGVSKQLVKRTQNWLLSRRDGKGNFKQNRGKYGFAGAEEPVSNAYIVYALAATGLNSEIEKEYNTAYQEVLKSRDAYRMALLANASWQLGKEEQAMSLNKYLEKAVKKAGFGKLSADHSVVRSYGNSLQVEIAALYAMALMKEKQPDQLQLQEVVNFLVSRRNHGSFGSTQGTVLALTALTDYAKFSRKTRDDGLISLSLNGSPLAGTRYDKDQRGDILLASLEKGMIAGTQEISINFGETDEALPYSFNARWTSYTPNSSKSCLVDISTGLSASEVRSNETVRLTTRLENKSGNGIPQTVAIVGIPSGLTVQPWQLKEHQEKELFDFYEVQGNFVIFYYREMAPHDKRIIHLDLKAEVPGTYQASASSAYLYYTNEHKDWEGGETIRVLK